MRSPAQQHFRENVAVQFTALAFMLYSHPATALEQNAQDNSDMPQTESVMLGQPLSETTLQTDSYVTKPEGDGLFMQAYDFAKRSGTSLVNDVRGVKPSSSDVQAAAPVVPVEQTPEPQLATIQPERKSTWDSVSDSVDFASESVSKNVSHLYDRTVRMFDDNNHN